MARCGCSSGCPCSIEDLPEADCIQVTVSGSGSSEDPYIISADPVLSETAGNQITCAADGLLVAVQALATYSSTGVLTVGAGTIRFRFPFAVTLLGTTAAVNTAPTGASVILDVNKNGTTIYTTVGNRPTIVAGAFATASEPTPNVTAMAAGDYLTVDIDQIGSVIAGADLTVFVRYSRP